MAPMEGPTALGQLVEQIKQANGWSLRDIERRVKERGMSMSKSRVDQLAKAWPLDSISADAVHALAAGLGVAPERVAIAAIQSMGFRVDGQSLTPAEAVMRDETLSQDTRDALLAILRARDGRRRGA